MAKRSVISPYRRRLYSPPCHSKQSKNTYTKIVFLPRFREIRSHPLDLSHRLYLASYPWRSCVVWSHLSIGCTEVCPDHRFLRVTLRLFCVNRFSLSLSLSRQPTHSPLDLIRPPRVTHSPTHLTKSHSSACIATTVPPHS